MTTSIPFSFFLLLCFLIYLSKASKPYQLSNLQIKLPSRALPGAEIQVKITAQVTPAPNDTESFSTNFTGQTTYFPKTKLKTETIKCATECTLTFKGKITTPKVEALFQNMTWDILSGKKVIGSVRAPLEVTCSDGVYCNGMERLVAGKCKKPKSLPCVAPNLDPCGTFECLEESKSCSQYPIGKDCLSCKPSKCQPKCGDRECGSDGCSGICGVCPDGKSCIGGSTCQVVTQDGTCAKPDNLLGDTAIVPAQGWLGTVLGDNSQGADMVTPPCNLAGVPEYVYKVIVQQNMGFEIIMTAGNGSNQLDTFLAIMAPNCSNLVLTAADRICSDDASPPGGLSSRVDGILPAGEYTVIATAYSPITTGQFMLAVKFTPNCRPKCDGMYCGNDDCGGTCGVCPDGEACNIDFRCQADPCIPMCEGRQCSDDGCGGTCGECAEGGICELRTGICYNMTLCDPYIPICPDNVTQNQQQKKQLWCGSDCQWHSLDEPLPDLYPNNQSQVIPSIYFLWQTFSNSSCAFHEGCVLGEGDRLLMRFDTRVHNIGTNGFAGPPPEENPQLFEWAPCHQHYHYKGFARYSIYDWDNNLLVPGAKLSYCMEDSEQFLFGSDIRCDQEYDCSAQGIPRGRTDVYAGILDCQWLDITDLKKKNCWYNYEVCTNWARNIIELSFENNCISFPIYIPDLPQNEEITTYSQILNDDNATSFYPGCKPK